ncbi:PH domain-containing protein [Saccharothrix violaceirubra]|uniref:Putative membrane protein n=1 Tax=Saccharothrix violaceirubra TaxID=413306 RepID=A0A7W7T7R5_9PSEU|nr:PH domain-containing protein [Saccharothrix violaceirubra]MBB4968065.1 putative membrane protein [Saccharothrix violaceirubra]
MTDPNLPAAPEYREDDDRAGWHRLDVRMLVVRPLNELLGLIPLLVGLLVLGNGDVWRTVVSGVVIAAVVLFGLLHWLTTRYRITDEQVELRTGLLVRKRLAVPRDRIRSVDLTAKPGHRLFGLSAIKVGTGRQDKPGEDGLTLDAVTSAEAERLRLLLLERRAPDTTADTAVAGTTLSTLDKRWLRFAPLTLSGLVAVGALAGVVFNAARDVDVDLMKPLTDAAIRLAHEPATTSVPLIAGAVVTLSTIGSLVFYVVQYWNFRLTREPDRTIRVRRGLVTTRSVSISEDRLRGVEIREPLMLRWGRGARTAAVTTGLGTKGASDLLLPPAPAPEAHRVAAEVLRAERSPTEAPLSPHPTAALRRRMVRALVPPVILTGVLAWSAPSWTWQAALALTAFCAYLGWDRYRALGHALSDGYLVTRSGSLLRETAALHQSGVIGWRIRRSYFQRRAGLATISATTAAGDGEYHVVDVAERDGLTFAATAVPDLLRPFLIEDDQNDQATPE